MKLFLRLTHDVNERLRSLLRYRGELSGFVEEALTSIDLHTVELVAGPVRRSLRATSAVVSIPVYKDLVSAAKARGCAMAVLANSAIHAWLQGRKRKPNVH